MILVIGLLLAVFLGGLDLATQFWMRGRGRFELCDFFVDAGYKIVVYSAKVSEGWIS